MLRTAWSCISTLVITDGSGAHIRALRYGGSEAENRDAKAITSVDGSVQTINPPATCVGSGSVSCASNHSQDHSHAVA